MLVSVVVTCYNYGKYLERCLNSIFSQTYRDIEIVVVNDGSTDDTDAVMGLLGHRSNLKYISQPNSGQAGAKNTGIKNSTGELVAFLDADDLWEEDKIEKQVARFDRPEVGVVYCLPRYIDEEGRLLNFKTASPFLRPRRGRVSKWLFLDNFVPFSSSLVRRECFHACGIFDEGLKMGIDWDLWLRISTQYEFDYLDERLFLYRLGHQGQMSKNLEERQRCSDRIMQNFLAANPALIPAGFVRKAYAYTYCNRGDYFSGIDREKSNRFFLDALRLSFFEPRAYKGLTKNLLRGI